MRKTIGRRLINSFSRPANDSLTLTEFGEKVGLSHADQSIEIEAMVADLESQMNQGGIALQEAKIALLTAFPDNSNLNVLRRPPRKGRNTK